MKLLELDMGPTELLLLVVVVLFLFGNWIVPKVGRRFGKSIGSIEHADEDIDRGRPEDVDT